MENEEYNDDDENIPAFPERSCRGSLYDIYDELRSCDSVLLESKRSLRGTEEFIEATSPDIFSNLTSNILLQSPYNKKLLQSPNGKRKVSFESPCPGPKGKFRTSFRRRSSDISSVGSEILKSPITTKLVGKSDSYETLELQERIELLKRTLHRSILVLQRKLHAIRMEMQRDRKFHEKVLLDLFKSISKNLVASEYILLNENYKIDRLGRKPRMSKKLDSIMENSTSILSKQLGKILPAFDSFYDNIGIFGWEVAEENIDKTRIRKVDLFLAEASNAMDMALKILSLSTPKIRSASSVICGITRWKRKALKSNQIKE